MQNTTSKKPWIITICVIVVAILVYFYFTGGPSTSSNLLQGTAGSNADAVGAQVLTLLGQIKSLHIDSSLFKDPGYVMLRDNTVPIPSENVGRINPFAPLPGEKITAPPNTAPATRTVRH